MHLIFVLVFCFTENTVIYVCLFFLAKTVQASKAISFKTLYGNFLKQLPFVFNLRISKN